MEILSEHLRHTVWLWFIYRISNINCRLLLFLDFIQTRKRYPTSLDKTSNLTWRILELNFGDLIGFWIMSSMQILKILLVLNYLIKNIMKQTKYYTNFTLTCTGFSFMHSFWPTYGNPRKRSCLTEVTKKKNDVFWDFFGFLLAPVNIRHHVKISTNRSAENLLSYLVSKFHLNRLKWKILSEGHLIKVTCLKKWTCSTWAVRTKYSRTFNRIPFFFHASGVLRVMWGIASRVI